MDDINVTNGAFALSLKRNNRQIREDRAKAIVKQAALVAKRAVEDLEMEISNLEMDRANMIDLSPTNAQSLILASDFNADEWNKKDLDISIKIRNNKIKLAIAKQRYAVNFLGVAEDEPTNEQLLNEDIVDEKGGN